MIVQRILGRRTGTSCSGAALLRGTALAGVLAALVGIAPAFAGGGAGGDDPVTPAPGGAPGLDSATGAGGAGGTAGSIFAGGGGGGAGVTGGHGGVASGVGGAGGDGGAHGSVSAVIPVSATGGNGADGAAGSSGLGGAGGGGGAGGAGAVVTGAGVSGVITGAVLGGDGGAGGAAFGVHQSGSGGKGGDGLVFTDGSAVSTITVNGSVTGGNGGVAGAVDAGSSGNAGDGGFGIIGGNLAITNNGTISGGVSGNGVTQFNSIVFTGGDNTLTFGNATSGLAGDILTLGGTLTFDQPTDVSVSNGIIGSTSVTKIGSGALTLSGNNTYTGGTTVSAGTLVIGVDSAGSVGAVASSAIGTGLLTLDGGTVQAGVTATLFNDIKVNATGGTIDANGNTLSLLGNISDGTGGPGGTLTIFDSSGGGSVTLSGNNDYSAPTVISSVSVTAGSTTALSRNSAFTVDGFLDLAGFDNTIKSLSGSGFISTTAGSLTTLTIDMPSGVADFSGSLVEFDPSNRLALTKNGAGTQILSGVNGYSGDTTVNAGTLQAGNFFSFSNISRHVIAAGATLDLNGTFQEIGSLAGAGIVTNSNASQQALLITGFDDSSSTFSGTIKDGAGVTALFVEGAGTLTLTGDNTYTGGTTICSCGTLQIGNGGTSGSIVGDIANGGKLIFNRADTYTFKGVISDLSGDQGQVFQNGSGTTILTAIHTYTGLTTVNNGKLVVNGSIASSSGLIVGPNGMIGGSGQLPSATINGILSPGNSPGVITINGNLTLGAIAVYIAEVQGAVADRVNVTGTAALAGTLRLTPLGGTYTFNSPYTLLSAAGGRIGTFTTVDTAGFLGVGVKSSVDYTGTDVLLTLTPGALTPFARPFNPASVARGIDTAIASGADASPFFPIFNQSAASLPGALNTLSGEVHTAASAIGFEVSDQFLRTMLDPFTAGRQNAVTDMRGNVPANPYTVWGAAFGRRGHTSGDPSGTGSSTRTIDSVAFATGADYRISPDSLIGFALAGGGASASLANGLGSADAGVFEAGLYGMTRLGDLKLGASAAYTYLDVDTKRTVPLLWAAPITAGYQANGFSGRLEASYRIATISNIGFSPFAAFQVQSITLPGFTEKGGTGGSLATLTAKSQSNLTTRSELGLKLEADTKLAGYATSGFVRAAWAQYFNREMAFAASINGLAGSAFTVDGAKSERSALRLATGFDIKLRDNIALSGRLDSDLARNSVQYGGSLKLQVGF